MNQLSVYQQRSNLLARPMFALSVFFVILLACLIVVWVDIPRVAELAELSKATEHTVNGSGDLQTDPPPAAVDYRTAVLNADHIGETLFATLLLIWPVFILEYLFSLWQQGSATRFSKKNLKRGVVCVIPPLRLAAPNPARDDQIWLPFLHWQQPGKTLSRDLERKVGMPMLAIALLILPVLLIEFGLNSLLEQNYWLRLVLHASTGFIWCAFTIEFIVMVSASDRKLAYVKKNWIDLAIILLPLISFLRSLRVLRLAKLAKVQQLAKMSRVYRVRGLLMKAVRALMLLEVVNRLLRLNPEKRLLKLKREYDDKLEELEDLKSEIEHIESQLNN